MRGLPDQHVRTEQLTGKPGRDIALPHVQHVHPGEGGEIGPIVGAHQRATPLGDLPRHGKPSGLGLPLQTLFTQLDDVHPSGEDIVEKLGKRRPEPGTQVEPGIGKPHQPRLGRTRYQRIRIPHHTHDLTCDAPGGTAYRPRSGLPSSFSFSRINSRIGRRRPAATGWSLKGP